MSHGKITSTLKSASKASLFSSGKTNANDVRNLRKSLGLSQAEFSHAFGFPIGTVRNWEQKNTKPDSAAQIIIAMIKIDPDEVARLVKRVKQVEEVS